MTTDNSKLMRTKQTMNERIMRMIGLTFIICHLSFGFSACSEEDDTVDEFNNWQQRNDQFFATLEDSLTRGSGTWMKMKSFSKDPSLATGSKDDCIYVKVIETHKSSETESPLYNDSVRLSYQGRLIPSSNNPEGKIFDGTVFGNYDSKTNASSKFKVSGLVKGFSTAVMNMRRGDTWLVYIPYSLGYGSTTSNTSIPAYSTLIFKMTLRDFAYEGKALPNMQ
jgi:FKBP-type peptidyl-prolyl cis-trans isomerase FklB